VATHSITTLEQSRHDFFCKGI